MYRSCYLQEEKRRRRAGAKFAIAPNRLGPDVHTEGFIKQLITEEIKQTHLDNHDQNTENLDEAAGSRKQHEWKTVIIIGNT